MCPRGGLAVKSRPKILRCLKWVVFMGAFVGLGAAAYGSPALWSHRAGNLQGGLITGHVTPQRPCATVVDAQGVVRLPPQGPGLASNDCVTGAGGCP